MSLILKRPQRANPGLLSSYLEETSRPNFLRMLPIEFMTKRKSTLCNPWEFLQANRSQRSLEIIMSYYSMQTLSVVHKLFCMLCLNNWEIFYTSTRRKLDVFWFFLEDELELTATFTYAHARIQHIKGKSDFPEYAEMSSRLCCCGHCEGMTWIWFVNNCWG
jgi:hypothetical protein